ncbi:hypothetical protein [Chitinophaga varians]|uniref:hypothetical protein n=1 Tax=Chitinophaga varians TaxID=2202339 RepID=UPI00165F456D|nr:hypothetical protein [Chitinophaga varians]MBC9912324.1 hypothetical protein [Chitinophaga varians]
MKKLAASLAGAIGSRYLKNRNQLILVEYGGFISTIDLSPAAATVVSQGTVDIKGTWSFDCETGTNVASGGNADIFWEQIDAVKRQMVPQGNARIVNLGVTDFNLVTAAALQSYAYSNTPIIGNNDATNKLVNGDVFCVQTKEGNYCKLKVITYGYNLSVQWVTYKLNPIYRHIGSGYNQPEDIAVTANEQTAYVTERTGNVLKVNLATADRAAAAVVCAGLNTPQQLWLDEAHMQAYVVEYANPGNLVRVDLNTGTKTVLYSGLNLAVGLTLTADLSTAYVTEQGGTPGISRITLATGTKTLIAGGLTAPFFLTWADNTESRLLVAERDPANRISAVDVTKTSGNVNVFIGGTAPRPSSIAVIQPGNYCICCNDEVDQYTLTATSGNWLYKGIGYVPWNLITAAGKADTTTQPAYPFQFPKDSPFGGTLPVNIDHYNAWNNNVRYYKVLIDGSPRFDSWNDLRLNPVNGHYDIIELQKPDISGFYNIHNPAFVYYNTDLGCLLNSLSVPNGAHTLKLEFYDGAHVLVSSMSNALLVNNDQCIASMDIPLLNITPADPNCGYLKYTNTADIVKLHWTASHPQGFATWSFGIIKGAHGYFGTSGALFPATFHTETFTKSVADMLGACPGVAAFAESLYVASTVINGVGRQSQYDASASIAFCLAP